MLAQNGVAALMQSCSEALLKSGNLIANWPMEDHSLLLWEDRPYSDHLDSASAWVNTSSAKVTRERVPLGPWRGSRC